MFLTNLFGISLSIHPIMLTSLLYNTPVNCWQCRGWERKFRALCCLFFTLCGFLLSGQSLAENSTLSLQKTDLREENGAWLLETHYHLTLSPRIEDAIQQGIPVYFNLQLELNYPRWYWLDKNLVTWQQIWRIEYHALSRRYRTSVDNSRLFLLSDQLKDALVPIIHARSVIGSKSKLGLSPSTTYYANVRLSLDRERLPRPFQVDTWLQSDWNIDSGWYQFPFRIHTGQEPSQ